jgi:hypothetical protein
MILLIAASAVFLVADQSAITAPTVSLKSCLKDTGDKATNDKVGGDAYEAYVRSSCTGQIGALRNALIGFEVKNGTKRSEAAKDADMTVDDYVASSVDNYKFRAGISADNAKVEAAEKAAPAPAPATTPAPTPASAPQPPK